MNWLDYPDVYALASRAPEAEAYIASLPAYVQRQLRSRSGMVSPSPTDKISAPASGIHGP